MKFFYILLTLCTLLCSCQKYIPTDVEIFGNLQQAAMNAQLEEPLAIRVLNHKSEPVENIEVRFLIKTGTGFFTGGTLELLVKTNSEGIAQANWTFGNDTGKHYVQAWVKQLDRDIIFEAEAAYLLDTRDGNRYLLTQIGQQTWMAENMRFQTPLSRENSQNPDQIYGKLYPWSEQSIVCPAGYRMPSIQDFQILSNYLGNEFYTIGKKLKSKTGWLYVNDGRNSFGFNLFPSGNFINENQMSEFRGLGEYGILWSNEAADASQAKYAILSYNSNELFFAHHPMLNQNACRCLKN